MDFISNNTYLDLAGMTLNAVYIFNKLSIAGWTLNAIAGVLGNMQSESTINPGLWENRDQGNMSGGYGLVQWTPATKYTDWADARNLPWGHMDSQLERIQYEIDNNIQWIHPSMTFYEFTRSDLTPYELAILFLTHYERPAEPNQPQRGTQAETWYTALSGLEPPTPDPTEPEDFFILNRKPMVIRRRNN